MKRIKGMFCIIFLYMMIGTLTVQAEDHSFDSDAGITFEGSMETEKPSENTGTTGSGKSSGTSSLPQTGQEASSVLPLTGCVVFILVCWWTAVKSRGKGFAIPERKRAG